MLLRTFVVNFKLSQKFHDLFHSECLFKFFSYLNDFGQNWQEKFACRSSLPSWILQCLSNFQLDGNIFEQWGHWKCGPSPLHLALCQVKLLLCSVWKGLLEQKYISPSDPLRLTSSGSLSLLLLFIVRWN